MTNLKETFYGTLAVVRDGEMSVSLRFGPQRAELIHEVGRAIIETAINTARLAQKFETYPPQQVAEDEFEGVDRLLDAADSQGVMLRAIRVPYVRLEELDSMRDAVMQASIYHRLATRRLAGIQEAASARGAETDLARIALAGGMFVPHDGIAPDNLVSAAAADLGIVLPPR